MIKAGMKLQLVGLTDGGVDGEEVCVYSGEKANCYVDFIGMTPFNTRFLGEGKLGEFCEVLPISPK